jgi:PST family polysaccharide transporter
MSSTVVIPIQSKGSPLEPADRGSHDKLEDRAIAGQLKERSIRAGAARFVGLGIRALLRIAAIAVLARLLDPSDFGLVAMVTVITGVFEIFATGGLAAATVQRAQISDEQISALFWMNLAIGAVLALLCVAAAPSVGSFYQDPRASEILVVIAPAFLFNAFGVQHLALLQRQLRYVTLSAIEVVSEVLSIGIGIGMAVAGWGYWALVASVLATPIAMTVGAWLTCNWMPGWPRRERGVGSMLWFGGTITANNLVVHAAYNLEKILLGRYFGPDALGLYGRAYELINLPTQIINSAIGRVAFSGLSRLQAEPQRFRNYFIKSYTLVISITLPTTLFAAVASDDIILVVLGSKWQAAAELFRLLAPAILVFGIINPLAWPLQSFGLQRRSLHLALALAPVVIGAYLIGIPYGPRGVAIAYSTAMALWLVPHVLWCLHGTPISVSDFLTATGRPLLAGIVAALVAAAVIYAAQPMSSELLRLACAGLAMALTYALMLLVIMRQMRFYLELIQGLRRATGPQVEGSV